MKKIHDFHIPIYYIGIIFVLSACKENEARKAPPPEIQVVKVIQKDVPMYRDFVGQVYGLVDIPIRARVEGYLEGLHFEEGFRVTKGQKLYTIDAQPFRAEVAAQEQKVAEAQTYFVNAKNELERYKPLAEINAVSKSDLDAAQANRDAAEASFKAAQANLRLSQINLSYTSIKSPIDGFIGKTEARVGEFVGREPNPVILNTVSNLESVRVQFFLTENEYILVARELQERIEANTISADRKKENVELILSDGSMYGHRGSIDFINRNVDASTGSILVQASFPNPLPRLLRPGMYGKIRVEFEVAKDALLVPQRCVTELQGQYSVYVIEEGNIVKSRQVKASAKIGDLWLITEGLSESDQVVIDGLQKVATGMEVVPMLTEFKSQTSQNQ